jgi:ABC-type oligopeptide transport system substrate-binding subunit
MVHKGGLSRISAWIAALLAVAACSLPDSPYFGRVPEPDPTHFRWCNSGEPEYIDPALATSVPDLRISYQLFDGLTTHDARGLPEPSLATSWEVSPDQRRFVFHLRRDARWSNGRALTADDFVYSLARVAHPLTASARAETVWKVKNAEPYTAGTAKLVLRDAPPFRAGDVVEVLPGVDGAAPPDSNTTV